MMLRYFQPLCDRLTEEMRLNEWTLNSFSHHLGIPAGRLGRIVSGPGRISVEDARALGRYWPHNSWYQISGQEELDTDRIIHAAFQVRKRGLLRRTVGYIFKWRIEK